MSYKGRIELTEGEAELLDEEMFRDLLASGARLKRKSIKDIVCENGAERLEVTPCFDWGEPVEGETW